MATNLGTIVAIGLGPRTLRAARFQFRFGLLTRMSEVFARPHTAGDFSDVLCDLPQAFGIPNAIDALALAIDGEITGNSFSIDGQAHPTDLSRIPRPWVLPLRCGIAALTAGEAQVHAADTAAMKRSTRLRAGSLSLERPLVITLGHRPQFSHRSAGTAVSVPGTESIAELMGSPLWTAIASFVVAHYLVEPTIERILSYEGLGMLAHFQSERWGHPPTFHEPTVTNGPDAYSRMLFAGTEVNDDTVGPVAHLFAEALAEWCKTLAGRCRATAIALGGGLLTSAPLLAALAVADASSPLGWPNTAVDRVEEPLDLWGAAQFAVRELIGG